MQTNTYDQGRHIHVLVLHQELSHMLTPQAVLGDELGEGPAGLAIFTGHDGGEVRPAGEQVQSLLRSYSGA